MKIFGTIRLLSLSMLVLLIVSGCGGHATRAAIHTDPTFNVQDIDVITLLPAVDARPDKTINVNLQSQLNGQAKKILEDRGYEVQLDDSDTTQLIKEDLKSASGDFIKNMGPMGATWMLVLTLDDVETKLTFGSTGNADVAGYLFNKNSGVMVWHDNGIGKAGQGGLIGMTMKGVMDEQAISMAVQHLLIALPPKEEEE